MRLTEESGQTVLSSVEWSALFDVAFESIRSGLSTGQPLEPDPDRYGETLRRQQSSFVTLHLRGRLRGCIGSLEATRALVRDVADNAYKAAFRDPRFRPLTEPELGGLNLGLSVLSPLETLPALSEADLIERVRPGIDGLVLEDGPFRGTFLPAVWSDMPDPRRFVTELKRKAGLAPDHWSDTLRIRRYTVESGSQDYREG